jgi:hypothetical protein
VSAEPGLPGLLTSVRMAHFVAHGFLRMDAVVPQDMNTEAMDVLREGVPRAPHGVPIGDAFAEGTFARRLLELPEVAGAIHSLVGPAPTYDFSTVIVRSPHQGRAQPLHSDLILDTRDDAFDITLMYYPQDVGLDMGGTLIVPGSHFRRITETDIGRYQNLRGQVRLQCAAGTVLLLHHGLWHSGRRNDSDVPRYMFKVRLNPTVKQVRLWDTGDLQDPAVLDALRVHFPWYEGAAGKLEYRGRTVLWRALTGDDTFDLDYWMTRIANRPQRLVEHS